jgi:signal transduction histidine kinase/CheY-like chemotaxis protein
MNNYKQNQAFNRLSRFYIIALAIIALLTIAGVFFIQWALYQQSNNAHLINIAGRQRMLSEQLSKIALVIQLKTDIKERQEYVDKLRNKLILLEKTHKGLQFGNTEIGLPGNNSVAVTRLFADLQPHYQAMKASIQNFLAAIVQNAYHPNVAISVLVEKIVSEQIAFVEKMNAIVYQYAAEAESQLNQVKLIVALLAILILIVLLLEGLYIFRPVIKKTQQIIQELLKAEEMLRNIIEGVSANTGTHFLQNIVEYLAKILEKDYVFIAQLKENNPDKMKINAGFAHNSPFEMECDLKNTLCENILYGKDICAYPQAVQKAFPEDRMLMEMGIESSFGTPLFDSNGSVIGLMMIMDSQPADNQKLIESMLQIFGIRISAELERTQALEALQQERASLTQRVEERTAELELANEELARAAHLKDYFLANMSHELRTPLLGILGIAEALQEDFFNSQETQFINIIVENAHRLKSLINAILEFAQITAGQVKLEIIPISTKAISDLCLRKIKNLADKKQIKITATIDPDTTIIQADERYLINKILLNLLNNAIKFSPEGSRVNLEIQGDVKRGLVDLTVSDTGKGIAEKDMERLFKPFVQLDTGLNRAYGGTGLGLAFAHLVTEMHGGVITVKSQIGKGSRFIVSLPWKPIPNISPIATETNADPQSGVIPENFPSSVEILLVDDNPTIIKLFSKRLETKGYQVVIAHNGLEAIEKTKECEPDLILMDIKMPMMDGIEAIRHIRANTEMSQIPIIAVTGLAVPGDKERCLEAGANDYLNKPVSFKGLIATIKEFLS